MGRNRMRVLVLLLTALLFVDEGVSIKIEDPAGQKSMRSCKWESQLAKMGEDAAKLGKNECKSTQYDLYQNSSSIPVIFCTCDTDYCNSAFKETAGVFLLVITAVFSSVFTIHD